MIVGRHVALRRPNGQHDGTLQLFRHNNELRVIRNEPDFAIVINPPLLPTRCVHPFHPLWQHPFQQHARPHDPPVGSRIWWLDGVGWTAGVNAGGVSASASSLLKRLLILYHRRMAVGGMYQSPPVAVDRSVRGGYLDRILARSPHTPLDACSHVTAYEAVSGACLQAHVLTSSADPFIAYIAFSIPSIQRSNVRIIIVTTEAPAAGVANGALRTAIPPDRRQSASRPRPHRPHRPRRPGTVDTQGGWMASRKAHK
ncbi:unnamed protein product [Vitrella brassicaformis CCMP3155]|uniref:Uncharacterized protein n=1 Tax=Vitrella brassicaformis (strain CCMP3155) TaxID=1169540 RepID=A0A0G4H722_VITBC|nr:unnamed protein product [Vitrella brassicaformis CCMP3155]|eukprot:CEM39672.1 unnamed protein product [Vitrella brassicaformis CCMP3155]